MITKWDDLTGKTITGVHYHSGGTVLLLGDEFVVLTGKEGYCDEDVFADLANHRNLDALEAAVAAEAPGAQQLLEALRTYFAARTVAREKQRLAYLTQKYGGTDK